MKDLAAVLRSLEFTPRILDALLAEVPAELLKAHPKPGKWCIHAHACHLAAAQGMLIARFKRFQSEDAPEFIPYNPDQEEGEDKLLALDLAGEAARFRALRRELLAMAVKVPEGPFWEKQAKHPEYVRYTPLIMLRHMLMHDHLHLYRIEELWLTRRELL